MTINNNNKRQPYPEELEKAIRDGLDGHCQSITIHFKNNAINSLELVIEEDPKTRLVDVLKAAPYQRIEVSHHAGRVSRIRRTVKVLIDKIPNKKGQSQAGRATQDKGCFGNSAGCDGGITG